MGATLGAIPQGAQIGATAALSVLFIWLALSRKTLGAALGVMIFSTLAWPEFLRFPLAIVQMSVPRTIALALLLVWWFRGEFRHVKFGKVDILVIVTWLWIILANMILASEFRHVASMIGRGMDTVLMYLVARVALARIDNLKGLYSGLVITAVCMCIAGVYEAITWSSPYHAFSGGDARISGYHQIRYGLLRAQASTMVSIYFGIAMMLVVGMLLALRGYVNNKRFKYFLLFAIVAVLSSMSSGPWIGLAALLGLYVFYFWPRFTKPAIGILVFLMLLLEVASNRHFYNLIDYVALDVNTSWYRTRLIEVGFQQLHEYWLLGAGGDWPHHWGGMIDGRHIIDVVNNFLIVALYGGLPALGMFVISHIIAIKDGVAALRKHEFEPYRKLMFGLFVIIIALDFASLSVGVYGPALLLSYVVLGACVSASKWSNVGSDKTEV